MRIIWRIAAFELSGDESDVLGVKATLNECIDALTGRVGVMTDARWYIPLRAYRYLQFRASKHSVRYWGEEMDQGCLLGIPVRLGQEMEKVHGVELKDDCIALVDGDIAILIEDVYWGGAS